MGRRRSDHATYSAGPRTKARCRPSRRRSECWRVGTHCISAPGSTIARLRRSGPCSRDVTPRTRATGLPWSWTRGTTVVRRSSSRSTRAGCDGTACFRPTLWTTPPTRSGNPACDRIAPAGRWRYGSLSRSSGSIVGTTRGVCSSSAISNDAARKTFFLTSPREEDASVSRSGSLTGLAEEPAQRHLEATPYVTGRGEYTHPGFGARSATAVTTSPRAVPIFGSAWAVVSRSTRRSIPIGQVEVDPAIVNLTDNETFFDEKRPFFLEGSNLFSFAQVSAYNTAGFPGVFNSRRIGRSPQRDLAERCSCILRRADRDPNPGSTQADR